MSCSRDGQVLSVVILLESIRSLRAGEHTSSFNVWIWTPVETPYRSAGVEDKALFRNIEFIYKFALC